MGQSVLNLQVSEELLTPYLALMSAFYSCILRLWSNFNTVLTLVLFPDLQFQLVFSTPLSYFVLEDVFYHRCLQGAVGFDYKITFQCPDLRDLCFRMYKMKKELLEGLSTAIQNIESISF
jgi:hypothetical protein